MKREDARRMIDFQIIENRIRESEREMANSASIQSQITNSELKAILAYINDLKSQIYNLEDRVEEIEDRVEEIDHPFDLKKFDQDIYDNLSAIEDLKHEINKISQNL